MGGLIGSSPEMEKVYRILSKVAHSTHPVLILGESGTGKEMVARAIHDNGPNAAKPFIPVDCGSLVPTLIESELFGHVKGAFTGANRSKEGLLSAADGGTVFLDEIGELPLDLQAKLLRALQEKEVRPVGATHAVPITARVLAATNRDLSAMVAQGLFRKDLYFRLNVVNLKLPPLRERREDIAVLAEHFLERVHRETGVVPRLQRGRDAADDRVRLAGQCARAGECDRARLRDLFGAGAAHGRPAHAVAGLPRAPPGGEPARQPKRAMGWSGREHAARTTPSSPSPTWRSRRSWAPSAS